METKTTGAKNAPKTEQKNAQNEIKVNNEQNAAQKPDEQPEQKPDDKKQPEVVELTIEQLEQNVAELSAGIAAIMVNPKSSMSEKNAAIANLQKAQNLVNKHYAKIESEKIERETAEKIERNKLFIAEKFGVELAKLVELVEADKADSNTPLRVALANVFGGKIAQAKSGETGTNLSGAAQNGEKTSSAKQIVADFLSAGNVTKAMMLQQFPTDGNPEIINGTARRVIFEQKWKVNPLTGFYEQKA